MKQISPLMPITLGLILFTSACATVPKEVVQLSYNMGGDLQAIHTSYAGLVHDRFGSFRAERMNYFEQEWKPAFIKAWVQNGHLTQLASGQEVWSKTDKKFVPANPEKPEALLLSVQSWASNAVKQLDQKKHQLIDPLDKDETEMIQTVDDAFNQLYRENAAITAHLNSIRKIKEAQDEIVNDLHGTKIKDRIENILVAATNKAQQGLEEIKKADDAVQDVTDKLNDSGRK